MKSFDELKSELEAIGKPELTEVIAEFINAERQKGIDEVSKRNREAQSLRKYKQAFEQAGLTENDNLEDFLKKKNNKEEDNLSLKSLKAELDRVKAERDSERNTSKRKGLQVELTNAIGDKVYGSKYLINNLINEGSVDIVDGEIVFKFGEEHVGFNDGLKRVLDENKDMLRTSQSPGSKTMKTNDGIPKDIKNIIQSGDASLIKQNFNEISKSLGLKV